MAKKGYSGKELIASWYDLDSLKRDGQWKLTKGRCADGSLFDKNAFTCASWDFPLKARLRITTIKSPKKSIVVENTDRTARRFKGKRIDVTSMAFARLDKLEKGLISVKVERIL